MCCLHPNAPVAINRGQHTAATVPSITDEAWRGGRRLFTNIVDTEYRHAS